MYFFFEEWEHYGTGGFKKFITDNEKKFKDYIIKRFKTQEEMNEAINSGNVVIIKGKKLNPKVKQTEIIKEIEL